jgi:phosphopantothenoylcysteine decarboxylase/phosphopantothenate--cysteine ligase
VTVLAANVSLPSPAGAEVVSVATAAELADACIGRFDGCDVLLMAAAVADFRPARAAADKLKKDQGVPTLELEATEDILAALAPRRRPGQVLVGFAAEHGDRALEYGRQKLARKGLDAIVVNDISQAGIGFDASANEVTVITASGGERHLARDDKDRVAQAILDELEQLWNVDGKRGDGARADRVPA